ncbi:hypothetical protein [Bradyrhizobium sp. Ash2021]|uniref:hypothetical protein n=1 Tax=Bradyrhizobium sp. Ash2021 TaxID=2954771 RepID=UPI002815B207|nr:hypothetical protein [Bradyrhizobium sp. Ash2021]WMT73703.1 hypothetical protein NL528_38170 [Bradyrhizobium sp. Ash2021]
MLRLYLYARVRFLLCILRTRPRVQQAPGIPCALFRAEDFSTARAYHAARREGMSWERHCERSEAIHLAAQKKEWIASLRSQ